MAEATHCPSQNDLERLARGEPLGSDALSIVRHVVTCETCADFLHSLDATRAMERDSSMLDAPADREVSPPLSHARTASTASPALAAEEAAAMVGPYKLLQKLGEGGMGTVWVAEQQQPVKRRVALKLIKAGMDSASVIRRFEAERQALALMDHTNIAKVFDAGRTPAGRPFFAMELVKGVPITRYCDELHLSLRERLGLFIPVCQAIQHAHQKGVIHRDIKPSNVLIAIQDGRPVPKVIDFGVAKALHQRLAEESVYTEIGAVIGTLEYMAPEQAELSALDVDTRADVYSLGVLLYQLLTGTTPLDRRRHTGVAYVELIRMIKEDEPPKPSSRLAESKESQVALAAQRRTEPARLAREVRGELDWIVMKALEKDRTRRYETANALARDIERYLHDETVEACPPSPGYKIRKLLRRHRGPALAVAGLILMLVAGVSGTSWGLFRARQAARAAERAEAAEAEQHRRAIADFQLARDTMDKMWTRVSYNWVTEPGSADPVKRKLLEDALAYYQQAAQQSGDEPEVRFEVSRAYGRLGELHTYLGNNDQASSSYHAALALQRKLVDEAPGKPQYLRELGKTCYYLAKFIPDPAKTESVRRALDIEEKLVASYPEDPVYQSDLAESYNRLGNLLSEQNAVQLAEETYGKALRIMKELSARYPDVLDYQAKAGVARGNLGELYQDQHRFADAERLFRQNEEVFEDLVKRHGRVYDRSKLALTETSLENVFERTGRGREAEAAARRWVDLRRELRRQFPMEVYQVSQLNFGLEALARLLADRKDYPQARSALEEAIDNLKEALRVSRHADFVVSLRERQLQLVEVLLPLGDHAAAAKTTFASLELEPVDAATHRRAASLLAQGVSVAATDKALSPEKRRELSERYAEQAVQQLREAVQNGFKDADSLAKDGTLGVLRSREDYKSVEATLKASKK